MRRKIAKLSAGVIAACALSVATHSVAQTTTADRCAVPRAPERAIVALVGTYEGQAVPSAAVDGLDSSSTLAFVDIEPGDRPLYVVLVSYDAMVWVFRGATERVATAVLITRAGSADRPGVGAVGLPAARVRTAHNCAQYFTSVGPADRPAPYEPRRFAAAPADASSSEASVAAAYVRDALGRDPDITTADYGMISVALPSGRISEAAGDMPPPPNFHARTWIEALRFHPGGLVHVDAASVVGVEAEAYDVLPDQVGLAQLAGSGELEYIGGYDRRGLGDYRIVAPIPRFPAGLGGAHSARFLIETGVPMPAGDPGHSCVILRDGPRIVSEVTAVCEIG